MIISFLGIHKYQTHPGFWHQYSYAKQTIKVWKTCSKLNFLKGFCECEQKKDANSIFLGTFFFTSSQSVWYHIFWAKLQVAMDIHGFPNRKFCYFSLFQILLFKTFKKIYQTETSFWNLEKCQNLSFPVWESMNIHAILSSGFNIQV